MAKNIAKLVGKGYKKFWEFKGRYKVVKGGRGSKKSTTTAIWIIYMMMKFFHVENLKPCTIVLRRFNITHRDSTFAQLRWAINHLGVSHLWKATTSPLELVYKPSGQKIIFRGLDDPQSITSVTVEDGELCWAWWEEAFQITNEDDFDKVDFSIRGKIDDRLFKQHILTFNPWSDKIWLKKRFFDKVGEDGVSDDGSILAITRNYDCNEFLGEDDLKAFEQMRKNNPHQYNIAGLGNWGISEGLVYENWMEREFDVERMKAELTRTHQHRYKGLFGLDFGYTNDPTAFIVLLADTEDKEIFIYDEIYKTRMSNQSIFDEIKYKGYDKEIIIADNEPRTIAELKALGLTRIRPAKKGQGSVRAGIQKLQDYRIYVHPKCVNTIVELNNYTWEKDRKTGQTTTDPIDDYNHLLDALRYATEKLGRATFTW